MLHGRVGIADKCDVGKLGEARARQRGNGGRGQRAGEGDPQHLLKRRTGRALGMCQHLADALVGRAQFAEQLRAERSQAYPPAGPFEQPTPDAAFQRLYRLADPGGRQVQPRRGSPEVQLVGHGEEGLDLPGWIIGSAPIPLS